MPRKIDLTGQKFGRWTVMYECQKRKNNNIYWHCVCSCGTERDVRGGDLRNGASLSCGCLQKEICAEKNSLNLVGQRFKRLVVLEKLNERKDGMIVWKCQCDCGNIIKAPTSYLTTGDTGSCGCLQKDRVHEICAKDISNQKFGKLTAIKPTNKREAKNIVWECKCDCGNTTYISAHTLLAGLSKSCGCTKSHGEEKISNLLSQHLIKFVGQKSFENCRFPNTKEKAHFDFFVDDKYLIEYDGEQHFHATNGWNTEDNHKKIVFRDQYKNQWCKENNIPLIRIPYTHLKDLNIEDLILETSMFRII